MIFAGKKYWFSEPERVELQRRICCTRKVLLSFFTMEMTNSKKKKS